MIKETNVVYSKLIDVQQNILDKDDIMSLFMIDVHKTYKAYDINKGILFTTVAFKSIENRSKLILRDVFAQKRTNETRILSLEGTKDDLDAIEKLHGEYDDTFADIELSYDLRRVLNSFSTEEKEIIQFILHKKESKKELAIRLGISRPTLDTRIKNTRDKLANSLKEYIA